MRAVIDTNVIRVAANQHGDASCDCIKACIEKLQMIQKHGVVYIDDNYKILGEYLRKPELLKSNEVGRTFIKWLLQNQANSQYVVQVRITEVTENYFHEFPTQELQDSFDPPDRKFIAVANALEDKPNVWQAVDCKWISWYMQLSIHGVTVEFLCPDDVAKFYQNKFPI